MAGCLAGAEGKRSAAIASSFAAPGEKGQLPEMNSEGASYHSRDPSGFKKPSLSHCMLADRFAAAQLPQPMHRPERTISAGLYSLSAPSRRGSGNRFIEVSVGSR